MKKIKIEMKRIEKIKNRNYIYNKSKLEMTKFKKIENRK